jgi:HK97 family phage prohead protease
VNEIRVPAPTWRGGCKVERRFAPVRQRRTSSWSATWSKRFSGLYLAGYAIPYNAPSLPLRDMPGEEPFVETFAPGSITLSLRDYPDVRALVEHDDDRLIGRTTSGTLRLDDQDEGLHFVIDVPDTEVGRDIYTLVKRQDVRNMSFGFAAMKERWSRVGGMDHREVLAWQRRTEQT